MVDNEPQRRRLTTKQQLRQRPVTKPGPSSTIPLRHRGIIPQLTLSLSYYTVVSKYYAPSYTSSLMAESALVYWWCNAAALLHENSNRLLHHQGSRVLHQNL
ncbi:hypothetical protein DAPPUDRAFT_259989 [Daphnia pulex]|uniref:Uncharacterized protein n=1 Tax=Daphnia pulex TaxID=6669 RepID=E9HI90_DAPPU|nr:hypothetical protein DAPPUDRAFT_259989 [Daphnia pulex]|eukprot:EFX68551.1 hypothetical protein DAPPUDRAFT_259989 [Daphnia pulex]